MEKTVTVKGMSCKHCVASVTEALEKVDGIENVRVDLDSGKVTYEETKSLNPNAVKVTVEKIGFDVE